MLVNVSAPGPGQSTNTWDDLGRKFEGIRPSFRICEMDDDMWNKVLTPLCICLIVIRSSRGRSKAPKKNGAHIESSGEYLKTIRKEILPSNRLSSLVVHTY